MSKPSVPDEACKYRSGYGTCFHPEIRMYSPGVDCGDRLCPLEEGRRRTASWRVRKGIKLYVLRQMISELRELIARMSRSDPGFGIFARREVEILRRRIKVMKRSHVKRR